AAITPSTSCLIATRVDQGFQGRAYGIQQAARSLGSVFAPLMAGMIGGWLGLRYVFIINALTGILFWISLRLQIKSPSSPK
ncbi:MAG TPA: MFS transporter, partial [Bacillota bacterium]